MGGAGVMREVLDSDDLREGRAAADQRASGYTAAEWQAAPPAPASRVVCRPALELRRGMGCPHLRCSAHLGRHAAMTSGWSCARDVATAHPDGLSLAEVGDLLGVTRERVRQLEVSALLKLRRNPML